jgi:hypothetical protein
MPPEHPSMARRVAGATNPRVIVLPIDEARSKAREIINQVSNSHFIPVVENWRQLSNGQIEFTVRTMRTSD